MSSTLVSAASSTGSGAEAEPLGAQPHLRDRLLARDVDDALPAPRERRAGLHEQRRLADPGIAADQDHRAAHEAAAGDPVELGEAGGRARRLLGFAGKTFERKDAALCPARARRGRTGQRARSRSPRRSCSSRRRPRTCPSSGYRPRRSSGRRRWRGTWPSIRSRRRHSAGRSGGRGLSAPRSRWCRRGGRPRRW